MEEAATITTSQSSTILSAPPVSSMITFETPVPMTNVIPSPEVSVSSSLSVPVSINAVPPLKDASISTAPAFPDVIHSIPSHKCPICKEMYIETNIEAHVDICLEKKILYPTVAWEVLSKENIFLVRTKKYLMFEGVT